MCWAEAVRLKLSPTPAAQNGAAGAGVGGRAPGGEKSRAALGTVPPKLARASKAVLHLQMWLLFLPRHTAPGRMKLHPSSFLPALRDPAPALGCLPCTLSIHRSCSLWHKTKAIQESKEAITLSLPPAIPPSHINRQQSNRPWGRVLYIIL